MFMWVEGVEVGILDDEELERNALKKEIEKMIHEIFPYLLEMESRIMFRISDIRQESERSMNVDYLRELMDELRPIVNDIRYNHPEIVQIRKDDIKDHISLIHSDTNNLTNISHSANQLKTKYNL